VEPFTTYMSTRHTFEPESPAAPFVTPHHGDLWTLCDFLVWLFTGHLLTRTRHLP